MTTIFLVGPSGAGKSELLKGALPRVEGARLLDLDAVDRSEGTEAWGDGWEERRWARDLVRLAGSDASGGLVIVDVGAGSIQAPPGRAYFQERSARSITIIADPEVVYPRKHAGRRTYADFLETEYGPERIKLYDSSAVRIDTSAGQVERNVDELVQAIQGLVS